MVTSFNLNSIGYTVSATEHLPIRDKIRGSRSYRVGIGARGKGMVSTLPFIRTDCVETLTRPCRLASLVFFLFCLL